MCVCVCVFVCVCDGVYTCCPKKEPTGWSTVGVLLLPQPHIDAVRSSQQQILLQGIEDHVILQVAAEWEPLASYLGVEPAYIAIIKKNNLSSCKDACRELFHSWINKAKGTGQEHRTWDSVVRAVRKMGLEGLADELNEK